MIDMTINDGQIHIGNYMISFVEPDNSRQGKVWIWTVGGPCDGEGGEFDADKLHKLIADFYASEF